ncbi:MAG: tryptophan 7-halogenase [Afipia sp.]|nr:tryptophan 7-halogenase [Afipia sp.]
MDARQAVVLGAGMAGMACARTLLRRGIRPLLVAPQQEAATRGETLSFRASPYLETLGWLELLDAETALPSQGHYSVWGGGALRRGAVGHEEMPGWHLDRQRLEARMTTSLDADGVERIFAEARQLSRSPAQVVVELTDGSSIAAEFVVDCSGRAAVTSGADASLRRLDRLVACYSIFTLDNDVEAVAATLVEAVATGWWYTSMIPGGRMLVGLFTDSDLLPPGFRKDVKLWAEMASQTTAVSARLASLGIDLTASTELQFASATTVTATKLVEPRIVRAGDAASALDPLGANGLATALWSGIRAAESVARCILHDDAAAMAHYEQRFLQGIASHLATQTALYASENRFQDAPFWQRRRGLWLEN